MIKHSLQTTLLVITSIVFVTPTWAYGGFAGGFADGLNRGMQLRLQQQQLEMMERAEKREEERHQRMLQQQRSDETQREEIQRDLFIFIKRHPEYNDQDRLSELREELQRLREVPENRSRSFAWFLEEGHMAIVTREAVNKAKSENLYLTHWERNDPEAWSEALRQDEVLRTNPNWSNKPFPERFTEVARRVRAIMPQASSPNVSNLEGVSQ